MGAMKLQHDRRCQNPLYMTIHIPKWNTEGLIISYHYHIIIIASKT
jgi:hypothetical protein